MTVVRILPTEASLGQEASKVHKALNLGKANSAPQGRAVRDVRDGKSICKFKGFVEKRHISNVDEEIKRLMPLANEVTTYRASCDAFLKAKKEELDQLSIFKPSTWKALFLETLDCIIIALFGTPLCSFGTCRAAMARVSEIREALDEKIEAVAQRELDALSELNQKLDPKTLGVFTAYELVGKLRPESKEYLHGIGERLLYEGAYTKAAELLASHGSKPSVRILYIMALLGAMKYREALQEIEAFPMPPDGLQSYKVDCLVGVGKTKEADALLQTLPETEKVIMKLLALRTREELEKADVAPADLKRGLEERCQPLFLQLPEPSKMVLAGDLITAAVEFWLQVLAIQAPIQEQVKSAFLERAKSLTPDVRLKVLKRQVENVKEQALSIKNSLDKYSFDSQEIPDTIKQALIEARKTTHYQRAVLGVGLQDRVGLLQQHQTLSEILKALEISAFDSVLAETDTTLKAIASKCHTTG